MRRKDAEREAARTLRAEGMSVRHIAIRLGVAKSSVSVWVRDVAVPREPEPPPGVIPPPPPPPPSGAVQRCSRCEETLPVEAFNRRGEGRQFYCRECFRAYFRERGDLHRRQVSATAPARRRRSREFMREFLTGQRCADCGMTDPLALEFDHLEVKRSTIARLIRSGASRQRLLREIALCDVVCANCHRVRTATRAGWFRVTGLPAPTWTDSQLRNHRHVLRVLRRSPCVDCGERNPVVLEFDHRGDKRGNVSHMASWASLKTLCNEIGKCDVRCANCHRRRTYEALRSYRSAAVQSVAPP